MAALLAAEGPLRWQPHPEVWFLVLCVLGLGLYVTRVIQPKMVAAGRPPVSRRQKRFFAAGVLMLWLASDWPVHDLGEEYLFSIHMVQHLVLTLVERVTGERFDRWLRAQVLEPMKIDACLNWSGCSDRAVAHAVVLMQDGQAVRDDLGGAGGERAGAADRRVTVWQAPRRAQGA